MTDTRFNLEKRFKDRDHEAEIQKTLDELSDFLDNLKVDGHPPHGLNLICALLIAARGMALVSMDQKDFQKLFEKMNAMEMDIEDIPLN
jgi:hypothetical protein